MPVVGTTCQLRAEIEKVSMEGRDAVFAEMTIFCCGHDKLSGGMRNEQLSDLALNLLNRRTLRRIAIWEGNGQRKSGELI